ncbi:hypothetical protein IFM89_007136, partial [Coptis chinensis]
AYYPTIDRTVRRRHPRLKQSLFDSPNSPEYNTSHAVRGWNEGGNPRVGIVRGRPDALMSIPFACRRMAKDVALDAKNLDDLNSVAMKFIEILTGSIDGGPILSFVGGAWVDHSCTLKPIFMTVAEEIYKAKAESVDFQNKAIEITEEVNKWVEESTNGLIKSVIYPIL